MQAPGEEKKEEKKVGDVIETLKTGSSMPD
jgi:hypothetical protein